MALGRGGRWRCGSAGTDAVHCHLHTVVVHVGVPVVDRVPEKANTVVCGVNTEVCGVNTVSVCDALMI